VSEIPQLAKKQKRPVQFNRLLEDQPDQFYPNSHQKRTTINASGKSKAAAKGCSRDLMTTQEIWQRWKKGNQFWIKTGVNTEKNGGRYK